MSQGSAGRLEACHKNSCQLVFGPADEAGRIEVTRGDLLQEGKRLVDLSPMDYTHPEGDWSGRIVINPLNRTDIERALAGYETWASAGGYPSDYARGLRALDEVLSANEGAALRVRVEVTPVGSAEVILREKET